jgi:hypothetical protein
LKAHQYLLISTNPPKGKMPHNLTGISSMGLECYQEIAGTTATNRRGRNPLLYQAI